MQSTVEAEAGSATPRTLRPHALEGSADDPAEVIDEAATGPLVSGPGGELEVPAADRRLVAIFRSGLAVIAVGSRWSPEVKALLDRARLADFDVQRIAESDSESIISIYEKHMRRAVPAEAQRSEIERQRDLRRLIAQAAAQYASDIHFQVLAGYCEIRARVHGRLRMLATRGPEEGMAIINAAFAVATDQGAESGVSSFMKGSLTRASGLLPPNVDLARLQYSPTSGHRAALVMRLKYSSGKGKSEIADLGYLPEQIREIGIMRRRTSGLHLIAGRVSSGKTTTLQRILNAMIRDKSFEMSAFAIEEPVELEISGAVHVAVVPKSGQPRADAFIEAIKATLRSDPNVVVLGELRDRELAGYAIELAMTGHALWSTVHAGSALGILDRLSDLGVEHWKLTEPAIVRGLIYQRLIGVICPHCKINYEKGLNKGIISQELASEIISITSLGADKLFLRGAGCAECSNGLVGRTVVAETVLPDPAMLDAYIKGDRSAMRAHWLKPKSEGGAGGIPVMHHAMIRVGTGECDVNEIEEEVDLVSAYLRDFGRHASGLAADLQELDRNGG